MTETMIQPSPILLGGSTNWLVMDEKTNGQVVPQEGEGQPTKHTFDSDKEVTDILARVQRAGFKKSKFINLCVKFGYNQALTALNDEQRRHVGSLLPSPGPPGRPSKK